MRHHPSGILANSATDRVDPVLPARDQPARGGARRRGGQGFGRPPSCARMWGVRLTEFWSRMQAELGEVYADSYARDTVIAELGGRTVVQALAAGEDTRTVWRAVCGALELPPAKR